MKSHSSLIGRMAMAIPAYHWGRQYSRQLLSHDLLAAFIVTMMLVPQSLAYAMLAGLPPEAGIYASIAPMLAYALLGSSNVLSVGPVAVVSLMTASALGNISGAGHAQYAQAAIVLAFLSGVTLIGLGLLRMGALANFLSVPVMSSFVTASGIIIAASQLKHLLGTQVHGSSTFDTLVSTLQSVPQVHAATLLVGAGSIFFLLWARRGLKSVLVRTGMRPESAAMCAKAGPAIVVVLASLLTWGLELDRAGVRIVGSIPQGLPTLVLPSWDWSLWKQLLTPAVLISIVGYVESVSIGQMLAARRNQRIEPNKELIALGGGNLAAAFTGGFPVTGGFARSIVNADAGARTPAAGAFAALGLALTAWAFTPALHYLPQAALAATIIVAVLSLLDFGMLKRTWEFSRSDFFACVATLAATLLFNVEVGLTCGVAISLGLYILRTCHPHIAEIGRVSGTEQFRNVLRHEVAICPSLLGLRVDESLYFANAGYVEAHIRQAVARRPSIRHVVLQCSAVNDIDMSALEQLLHIQEWLSRRGIRFHLSEVKGPLLDRLGKTDFTSRFHGEIFASHYQAVAALEGQSQPE